MLTTIQQRKRDIAMQNVLELEEDKSNMHMPTSKLMEGDVRHQWARGQIENERITPSLMASSVEREQPLFIAQKDMKIMGYSPSLFCMLLSFMLWSFSMLAGAAPTPTPTPIIVPVDMGSIAHFAVLAGYAVTNIPASVITGDVGVSPGAESFITGFSQTDWTGYATSPQVTGKIYGADMADPTPAKLTQAKGDLTIAYNDAAGRTPVPTGSFLNPGSGNLAGLTLVPGLYKFTGEVVATSDFTLTGGANDVWIFQIASALHVSNGVHVTLAGSARASNIFWQVGTSAIFGTNSVFQGTVLADASITMKTGATLIGRALAFSGTVTLDRNIIRIPKTSTAAKDWQLY